ncbi:MAG: GtrA family protein [Paracoccaceae bacterium]
MKPGSLHQAIRFGIVGASVAALYVVLYLLLKAVMAQGLANALAFLIAVGVQYVGQTVFTFNRPLAVPAQIGRFAAMIGCGLLISALITGGIGPQLGWPDWVAAVTVTIVLPAQNYLFMKLWVYSDREAAA